MAPITIGGHKAYGVFVIPGMGFRNNNAKDIAINDESEGIYYVIDGTHFDSGCCFDYGNSSTNGRAVGTGTMETAYFGTSTAWGRGDGPGPWIMSDMEAGLFSGHGAKQNIGDPTIDSWRFVTAVMDGGGGNKWDLRGGDAQKGKLTTYYSGVRPSPGRSGGYFPMHKQGGILLGTGGDNGNGSSGTFYEGVMTAGYPTEATTDAVQANVVAAKYDVQRVGLSRVTTFTPGMSQDVTATFTNTTGAGVKGLRLSVLLPNAQWKATAAKEFSEEIAAGASVSATFKVTSPSATGSGYLTGKAEWKSGSAAAAQSDSVSSRVRNVQPVKINEVRFSTSASSSDQFIELYNASDRAVDVSNWKLVSTQSQWASVELTKIPAGTSIKPHSYYVLGLAGSGLVAPVSVGTSAIPVREASGFAVGQKIDVDGEKRSVAGVGTAAEVLTTIFIPVSTGPWLKIPVGSTNLPATSAAGFVKGEKIGIDLGGHYEVATVTKVGKAATQTELSEEVAAGATRIKVAAEGDVLVGDTLTIGTGTTQESVKVASVGGGIGLASPLRFAHAKTIDVSDVGTGISFSPATKFAHTSGEAVQALGSGIKLDRPLERSHGYGAAVVSETASAAGYQATVKPNQWFGGALSTSAGSIALMDASGATVVDAMVYGSQQSNSSGNGTIASPELATLEGDQGQSGCIVVTPGVVSGTGTSVGRFPDGNDTDNNCKDFVTQAAAMLAADSVAGANNIKVASVAKFAEGQTVVVGTGADAEKVAIAEVGSAGAATVNHAIDAGVAVIPVAGNAGLIAGQTITVDAGANAESAVVVSTTRRGPASITVTSPLTKAHASGAQVAGTGITLSSGLKRAHGSGAPVVSDVPTPGGQNQYSAKRY